MATITFPTSIGGINIPGNLLSGPLGALYQTNTVDFLKYPRDLESSIRAHVVKFTINEIEEVTLDQATQWATSTYNDITNSVQSAVNNGAVATATNIVNDIQNAYSSVADAFSTGGFASTVTQAGNTLNKIKENFTTQKTHPVAYIGLYMPDTMNFTYTPEYDSNVTLASAAGALPLVGSVASTITNNLEQNDAVRLILNKAGYVFNPQRQLLFKGIDFRTFQMSFTFTPYSRTESDTVNRIIKLFRKYAAPTIVTEGVGMFFKPPAVFDIDFLFNSSTNTKIPKLKRSVITNVDVNYAPNGWATLSDGTPVQTTMTLEFQEMVLVDSTAIDNGY